MKFKVTLLLIFSCNLAYSQLPTLDQLLILRVRSIADFEETIAQKKWKMIEVNEVTEDKMGSITFAYGTNSFDDKARAFITLLTAPSQPNRIQLQINHQADYLTYMSKMKQMGFKLSSSKVIENSIIKVYTNKTSAIRISTYTGKEEYSSVSKTSYNFLILKLSDLQKNFED